MKTLTLLALVQLPDGKHTTYMDTKTFEESDPEKLLAQMNERATWFASSTAMCAPNKLLSLSHSSS